LLALLATGCGDNGVQPFPDGGGGADAAVDLSFPATNTLATAQTSCLVLASGRLFFVDERATGNVVASVPIAGGAVQDHATGASKSACVAADDTYVYFVTTEDLDAGGGDTIARVHWATTDTPQTLASQQHLLSRLELEGGKLWWTTDVYGPGDGMFSGKDAIVQLAADGSGSVQVVFSDLVPKASHLAVDAANVYYSDNSGVYIRAQNGGSAAVPVGTSSLHQNVLAIDSMHLAIVEVAGSGMGDVALFKLDGSGRTVLSPMLASAIAVDGSGVYANQGGRLVRLALDGSGAKELEGNSPHEIVLDPTSIYFSDGVSILKLGK
jgi:hypothetical protein